MGACQDSPFFMQYKKVDVAEWHTRDSVVFRLPETTDSTSYGVKVHVRAIQNFKYDNLALVVKLKEGKKTISTDTVRYTMLDENGESYGTGFPYVEHEANLKGRYILSPDKKYRIKVTHIMRLDPLNGISDIGVTITAD